MDEAPAAPQVQTKANQAKPGFDWDASEYIHHQKPLGWYLAFFAIAAAVAGLIYVILDDVFAASVVVLMFIALFIYAVRKPETLHYHVGDDGMDIGQKHFGYDKFRSFAIVQAGAIPNIILDPLQRFSPPISMYCAPEDVQTIATELTKHLPQTSKQLDVIDKLTHYLRF